MLHIEDLHVHYGAVHALKGISLEINPGEIVTLVGANGAGKSTLLRTISALEKPSGGTITYNGVRIDGASPESIVNAGICHSPEGRRVFAEMSVHENLELGAYLRKDNYDKDLERVLGLFPRLKERYRQRAGTLSGGEQQMLAIARALMGEPTLLLLDEPSLGLAPLLVKQIFEIIEEINSQGMTILLVEQNAHLALRIAQSAYVLEVGEIVLKGPAKELAANEEVRKAYLGE
ncbi:MAG: ABC transporter ATP-binding protein [Chrysiogenetes bacterium]|nr:ABC transporter ATP-binding protein [Chrysiogenetes bacterium]